MIVRGFEFPDDCYLDLDSDLWIRVEEEADAPLVRIGVTSFGVQLSGSFFMCRPKPVGTVLEAWRTMAIVELNKTVVSIKSPLTGEVVSINEALEKTPELVETDCYGAGWLVTLRASNWLTERSSWVKGESGRHRIDERIALEPDRDAIDEPALPPPQL